MATPSPEQVIESQRQDWNRVAGGWEKWDRFFDEQMAFLNHRLVGDARIRACLRVLDLGSGTGYPAILAAQTVGQSGSVIGVDWPTRCSKRQGEKRLYSIFPMLRFVPVTSRTCRSRRLHSMQSPLVFA